MLREISSVDNIDPLKKENFLLDSNVIIQFLDKENVYHEEVKEKINSLYLAGVHFYYPAPALLEVKNHWRLKLIHEAIQLSIDNNHHFFKTFEKYFLKVAPKRRKKNSYLKDHDVKKLRDLLWVIHNNKGINRWFELCKFALDKKIHEIIENLEATNIEYTNFGDNKIFLNSEKDRWPKWSTVDNLIEKYALSSNDAAILNMAFAERIDGFISNDKDLIIAIEYGAYLSDKSFYTFTKEGASEVIEEDEELEIE